ncbi:DUF2933 domain-containing protein [Halomonas sp. M20]|uniref:DUF2933 domain-containing protein n=1 Tax=Halomonas sp. M20 TaxID=2763264 RepID=UPI001D0AF21C|nr:DUF2933 domain-containing protein [Halomonas sp. M20]
MADDKHWLDQKPSKGGFTLIAGLALAAVVLLLWEDHKAHLLGALPWLILLACPLIHVFMHRGHGSHGGNDDDKGGGDK